MEGLKVPSARRTGRENEAEHLPCQKKKGHRQNEEDQKYKNDEEISRKERRNRNERNRIIQHSTRPVNNNWSETV